MITSRISTKSQGHRHRTRPRHSKPSVSDMAFGAWSYFLFITIIIAVNHKFAKPWDDHRDGKKKRRQRTRDRMTAREEAEEAAYQESKKKRREARQKRRFEEERLEEIRQQERRWMYGHHGGR
jgi:flagellar biosynthesis/type III secretory pathway M-ring protein FliF/YscJ